MVMISTQISELNLNNIDGQLTQTVILSNISWQTYQAMVADMGDHRVIRIAYNQKILTLKMPSKPNILLKVKLSKNNSLFQAGERKNAW